MGLVYQATHARLNKPLAIKVLRRENTKDPEVLERFQREAEAASGIGNQHIVDVIDFGTLADGSTYFVMERLHGVDLIDAIDLAGRMPEERAIRVAGQICRALSAAHDAGIVHRDLKPENVFLIERDGVEDFVKVLDFGIAKVAHGPNRLTRAGEVLGTPHYMSPEQCEGEGIDHRTDIYALGVLLYEMLTGHVPHDADTMMGILTKHLYEDPVPPKVRVPEVSAELEQVIMRCLEKKADHRYQTMHEIHTDLVRIHEGHQPKGPETITHAPKVERRRGRGRTPVFVGGLAVAVLVLLGSLALGARSERNDEPANATASALGATSAAEAPPVPDSTFAPGESEEANLVPSEEPEAVGKVVAPDAVDEQKRPLRAKQIRQKPRRRPAPSLKRDPAILDPWN
jgi:serine/threonine-protein kinase